MNDHDPLCPPGLKAAPRDRCVWCVIIDQARTEGPHRPGTDHDNLCPAADLEAEWNGATCQCRLIHAARESERHTMNRDDPEALRSPVLR